MPAQTRITRARNGRAAAPAAPLVKAPAVNVSAKTPHDSMAAVWTGDDAAAPGLLPRDTNLYGLPLLFILAPVKDRGTQFAITIAVAFMTVMWYYVLPRLSVYTMLTAIIAMGFAAYLFVGLAIIRRATREVHVFRRIAGGMPVHDIQRWWRRDEAKWPQSWRHTMRSRSVLWVDALEYDPAAKRPELTLFPFNPYLAPLPSDTSQAKLGKAWARRRAARGILDARSGSSVAIKQGLIAGAIVACIVAIYLGGMQIVEQLNGTVAEDIKTQIREELLRELQPQPKAP